MKILVKSSGRDLDSMWMSFSKKSIAAARRREYRQAFGKFIRAVTMKITKDGRRDSIAAQFERWKSASKRRAVETKNLDFTLFKKLCEWSPHT